MIDPARRVLLADPDPATRTNLRRGLNQCPDIHVIGESESDERAVFLVAQLQPDVVLLTTWLERTGRISLTSRITAIAPQTHILVLADPGAGADCASAILAGAHGACLRTSPPTTVAQAIRALARGETWIDDDIPLYVYTQRTLRISPIERRMLKAVAIGMTNYEIARDLGLRPQTIKNKLSLLYRKLQVSNRTEAVRRALQLDLIS
ncbi:MAG: response regulator transcription factor [Ardenticatenaceae bacterium]|nr:response regulator transcription factor [Ardenticatenaceae bacterium]